MFIAMVIFKAAQNTAVRDVIRSAACLK